MNVKLINAKVTLIKKIKKTVCNLDKIGKYAIAFFYTSLVPTFR